MQKPLYVSDLDGTLMNSEKIISPHSVEIINRLVSEGVNFTIATARTYRSAFRIIRDIDFRLPVITLNGTVLSDTKTGKAVEAALFSAEDVAELRRILRGRCGNTVVKAFFGDDLRRTYLNAVPNEAFAAYLEEHGSDPFVIGVDTEDELFAGKICFLSLIAPKETLEPIHEEITRTGRWETLLQQDTYREDYWLEVFPKGSSKAEAMRKVINDLSGFRIADKGCAVSNASEELKAAATEIIGSNDEDAVAEWLRKNAAGTPV